MIVEDGTGLADANSLTTVEFADAYHAIHPNKADWDALSDKAAYLIAATAELKKTCRWLGSYKRYVQALPFPRYGIYDRDGRTISADSVPEDIQKATAELARLMSKADVVNGTQRDVTSRTTGPVSVTYGDHKSGSGAFGLPSSVTKWLDGYIDTQRVLLRA